MHYIYDIYLNLNETLYDFFDWNKNDCILHIKKIPVIKVSQDDLNKLINSKVQIDDDLLIKLFNKTEIWNASSKITYCSLFTDGNNLISIEFSNKGNSIKKSFLFIDEELEVLEIVNKLNTNDINFKVTGKEKYNFKTRKQIKDDIFIKHELKNMEDNKLNYIYFECFGIKEKNKKIILDNINKIAKNSKIYKNLYDILKFTSSTKK